MKRPLESSKDIGRSELFKKEEDRLTALFADVDPNKRELVSGLIKEAAFLYAEDEMLRGQLSETGTVRFHPQNPQLQKSVAGARQYLSNVNTYAAVIGRLSRVMDSQQPEEDDDMSEYE